MPPSEINLYDTGLRTAVPIYVFMVSTMGLNLLLRVKTKEPMSGRGLLLYYGLPIMFPGSLFLFSAAGFAGLYAHPTAYGAPLSTPQMILWTLKQHRPGSDWVAVLLPLQVLALSVSAGFIVREALPHLLAFSAPHALDRAEKLWERLNGWVKTGFTNLKQRWKPSAASPPILPEAVLPAAPAVVPLEPTGSDSKSPPDEH